MIIHRPTGLLYIIRYTFWSWGWVKTRRSIIHVVHIKRAGIKMGVYNIVHPTKDSYSIWMYWSIAGHSMPYISNLTGIWAVSNQRCQKIVPLSAKLTSIQPESMRWIHHFLRIFLELLWSLFFGLFYCHKVKKSSVPKHGTGGRENSSFQHRSERHRSVGACADR